MDPVVHARMSAAAPLHAARFSWELTVDGLMHSYSRAVATVHATQRRDRRGPVLYAAGR